MTPIYLVQIAVAAVLSGATTARPELVHAQSQAASCDPTRDVFLLRQGKGPTPGSGGRLTFLKFQADPRQADVELGTLDDYTIKDASYDRKGRVFLMGPDWSRRKLYVYSICTGTIEKVIDFGETPRAVWSARYVGDGDRLIVTTEDDNGSDAASNSRLEVYEHGERVSSAAISDTSPEYASPTISGVVPDGSVVYLNEAGGDAGDVWGSYYRWDKTTNTVRKLGEFRGEDGVIISGTPPDTLNPSASLGMRVNRAKYAPEDMEPPDANLRGVECLKREAYSSGKYDKAGDELAVRDLATGEARVAYRNLLGSDNLCRNYLRVVFSPRWLDDQAIAFSTPLGIYRLDAQSGEVALIASEDSTLWNNGVYSSINLAGANDEYLFTTRSSVIHLKTGKELSVPALRLDPEVRRLDVTTQFLLPAWTDGGSF